MKLNKIKINILFIEDTLDDSELAVLNLSREGYDVNWKRVDTEPDLRGILSSWVPDIILSDYSMPSFSGRKALVICQELAPEIPFIFLSGTIGEELAIESIHDGATDYVLKDNMRRLSTSISRAVNDAERRRQAREVEKERSRLIAILEATTDFVVIALPDESLLYMNKGSRLLLDRGEDLTSMKMSDLYPAEHWQAVKQEMLNLRHANGNEIWQGDTVLLKKDGGTIPVSQVVISHRGSDNNIEYYSFIARDIRERRAYEQQIQYLANYDSLTALPNRSLLADRTTQAISYCKWNNRSLAMLVIDIDRFKLVNDGYGQELGDGVLKQFGERLRAGTRSGDTIARLTADCFAVLATELNTPDDVIMLISKLQNQFAMPFQIDNHNLLLSTGIGISVYPRDGTDFATLLQNADIAMHRMKESGEGGFQFYTAEMTRNASDRVRLENELRQALAAGELELHYQPQVFIKDEQIIGVEALMRWNHPLRGMIPPGLFIPIAENTDLIYPMGEWALYTACSQLKEWDKLGKERPRMAVNVSARQFRSKGFTAMVDNVLSSLKLDPGRLELELTESVLVHDHQEAFAILNQLNDLGVKVALDDFGTGYSNMSYLSRLPIHCLKIDQSFVQRALNDKNDAEIVRAIITLADALELRAVAEGIETQEQLQLLRNYNCSEGQGYLFSRPVPAARIPALLAK